MTVTRIRAGERDTTGVLQEKEKTYQEVGRLYIRISIDLSVNKYSKVFVTRGRISAMIFMKIGSVTVILHGNAL
jgi:hypothetical protein